VIPKTFTLVNREWMVRLVTSKQLQRHLDKHPCHGEEDVAKNLMGLCDRSAGRIFINKDLHHSDHEVQATYWHEFVHAMKYANGEDDHDEAEVDRIAGYLHQYHLTLEGEAWASK
jgi:hypothetical protein